ncbi:MAG: hypothetical protein ACREI8_06100, partial [Myxococcota bacterium]
MDGHLQVIEAQRRVLEVFSGLSALALEGPDAAAQGLSEGRHPLGVLGGDAASGAVREMEKPCARTVIAGGKRKGAACMEVSHLDPSRLEAKHVRTLELAPGSGNALEPRACVALVEIGLAQRQRT